MGAVIDLVSRLRRLRRMRGALDEEDVRALYMATQVVRETEQEMLGRLLTLCDRGSTPSEVEEAAAMLPLLEELLAERRKRLRRLEKELFEGGGAP